MKKYYKFKDFPEADPIDAVKIHFTTFCKSTNPKTGNPYKEITRPSTHDKLCDKIIYCIADMIHNDSEYTKIFFIRILSEYIPRKSLKLVKTYLEKYYFDYRAYDRNRMLYKLKPGLIYSKTFNTKYDSYNFKSVSVFKLKPYIITNNNKHIKHLKGTTQKYNVWYVEPKKEIKKESVSKKNTSSNFELMHISNQFHRMINSDLKEVKGIKIEKSFQCYSDLIDYMISKNDDESLIQNYNIIKTEEYYKQII